MKKIDCKKGVVAALGLSLIGLSGSLQAASDTGSEYMGSVEYVAFNFVPRDYASCDGQLMSISSNQALFSLLGTVYGGDGRSTFGLPNMKGRVPIHTGTLPGYGDFTMGQMSGNPVATLQINNLPAHNHSVEVESISTSVLKGINSAGTVLIPGGNSIARSSTNTSKNFSSDAPSVDMNSGSVATGTVSTVTQQTVGNNQSFSIMQPYTVLRCIVAVQGLYPPRQ